MRIAVSGTHSAGKSTLIEAFLQAHPEFAHEPEPYAVLQEDYGEEFAAEPTADDFLRQLEFQTGRLCSYKVGQKVIFERSPVDFLAYLLALDELDRETADSELIEQALPMVQEAIGFLDVILFLPINDRKGGFVPEDEDPELRSAVNQQLEEILMEDRLELFTDGRPVVVEAEGSTSTRLRVLENVLEG